MVSIRVMELETAKEILAEVFHARPGEVGEMIQMRLEESGPVEREEGRWPQEFWLGIRDGAEIRERENGCEGCLSQMAEGQPGTEEGRPGLRAKGGRDGQKALQRGVLCAGRSAGGGGVFGAGGDNEKAS